MSFEFHNSFVGFVSSTSSWIVLLPRVLSSAFLSLGYLLWSQLHCHLHGEDAQAHVTCFALNTELHSQLFIMPQI